MNYKMSHAHSDAASRPSANLSKGYPAVFATVFIWSVPSLFMFYLNRYYDPWAQNFYRYSVACIAIAPLLFYQIRRGGPRIDMHAVKLCLLPCLPNVVHQVTQVMALFYIGPGVYTIFTRASVIFTALLALAFFPEERVVIRQWQFQVGTLLGLIGAFGVIWFQANANSHDQHVALPGLFIAFTATFCWALYGVLIKRPSAELGSIRSFGLVSFITSALLFPLTLAFGKIGTPFHAGRASEPGSDRLRSNLYYARPRFVLCGDSGNRSRVISKPPTPLPGDRDGALCLALWRTTHARATLERRHSAYRCLPCNANQAHRHGRNS